jgi:chemotaxis protein methyltransferase CheR
MRPQSLSRCRAETGRDFILTAEDFHRLADLARAEAGIVMTDTKEPLVYARLVKRLRQLCLTSFADYVALLSAPCSVEERALFVSTMTTNTTHFFRESHHFETLSQTVLPPLLAAARRGRRVRLWSAGCSSGEEPYSIAMTVLQLCPAAAALDLKILATDVDRQILERACLGCYPARALGRLTPMIRGFFEPADASGCCRVTPEVRELVTFKPMNLVRPWPVSGPFDVIFCRNVAIYFDADTQDGIWRGFAATLGPGGHLFIGHSERLSPSVKNDFETIGMTTFRLRGAGLSGPEEGDDGCR